MNNYFLTHIEGDDVFSTNDTKKMLEKLYQEHLCQNQGVLGNTNKFSTQKNKTIKPKSVPGIALDDVCDTTIFPVGTQIFMSSMMWNIKGLLLNILLLICVTVS